MKIVIEIPELSIPLEKTFEAVDHYDCWDGCSINGSLLEANPTWEDVIDSVKTGWVWLNACLPDTISSRLAELDQHTCDQFLDHVEKTLRRGASIGLQGASIDLSVDRLAWPHDECEAAQINDSFHRRVFIMGQLVARAQRYDIKTSLSLRLPLPSIARGGGDIAKDLIKKVGNSQCKLMLNIMIDELKTLVASEVLDNYIPHVQALRLRYEPQLGLRPSTEMQQEWAGYLRDKGFDGTLILAPRVEHLDAFDHELKLLTSEVTLTWRNQ